MSKIVGEYILKERIGKGSYADVYKSIHKQTNEKFAIKVISKEILSEPKLQHGLESEIQIMKEFSHINIVKLYEYFSSEKNFYLVQELCEGGDLSRFIRKRKRIDENLSQSFLLQLINGLSFLQDKNYIHRDLKPANVLLSEFSDRAILKLADFGFAKELTVTSLTQTRCGTPLYMAPEILECKDYDGKADIWSVGCIFYEMLVGCSPFKGTNEADLLLNIKTKELSIPKEVILSKVSIDILKKLLERNPAHRASLVQLVSIFPSNASIQFTNNTLKHPSPSSSPVVAASPLAIATATSTSGSKDIDRASTHIESNDMISIQQRRHSGTGSLIDQTPRIPGYGYPINSQIPRSRSNSIGASIPNKESAAFNSYSNNTLYKAQITPIASTRTSSGKHNHPFAYSPPINNPSQISTGNIGMMGNLIAFVFNSSPVNVPKQNSTFHNFNNIPQRSFSLDASTGSDSSKHRTLSQYSVCEEYFATGDNSKTNNSQITTDGDFVIVNNSPKVIDKTLPNKTFAHQKSVSITIAKERSSPEVEILKEKHRTNDTLELERAALLSFYESLVHRCEVYCTVVNAISGLGDQYIIESTGHQYLQNATCSTHNSLDGYLHACSLYLHALSILSKLMKSVDSKVLHVSSVVDQSNLSNVISALKQDLSLIFTQLIQRAEDCQKEIHASLQYSSNNSDTHNLTANESSMMPDKKYIIPAAEPIMLQAALRKESDASIEELVGNLNKACKLYTSANELIEGVALTAHETEDQRKLQSYASSLLDKQKICKKKADELYSFGS